MYILSEIFLVLVIIYSGYLRINDINKINNNIIKILLLIAIAWIATNDMKIALIMSISFFLTLSLLNEYTINEYFSNKKYYFGNSLPLNYEDNNYYNNNNNNIDINKPWTYNADIKCCPSTYSTSSSSGSCLCL